MPAQAQQPAVPTPFAVATGAGVFMAPMISAMSAAGTDNEIIANAEAQENVSISGIHYDYTGAAHVVSGTEILNNFTVTKSSPSGPLSVSYSDSGNVLRDALRAAINASNLKSDLETYSNEALDAYILNTLGLSVGNIDNVINVDASGGAVAAVGNLGTPQATTIYLQIPQAQLDEYSDANHDATTSALPLKAGDKIVFVFDVTTSAGNVTLKYQTTDNSNGLNSSGDIAVTNANPQNTASSTPGQYAYTLSGSSSAPIPNLRVALALQFGSGGAAFAVGSAAGQLKSA
jgi:hypothetical protein